MLLEDSMMLFRGTKMNKIGGYIENYVRIIVLYTKGSLDISQRKKYFEIRARGFQH
jgi:hypothetical protein